MNSDIRIGPKLETLRDQRNFETTYVAEELGFSPDVYLSIEKNQTPITFEQAEKFAVFYKIDISDLLSKDNPTVSFINNHSATYGKSYVNNNYETQKEANDQLIQAKEQQILSLEKQVENLQNQVESLQGQVAGFMELLKKK